MKWGSAKKYFYGGERNATSFKMELMAAVSALEALKRPVAITIVTDSRYLRAGVDHGLANWKVNGWKTTKGKDVEHRGLWERLDSASSVHKVRWVWARSLASAAARGATDLANLGMSA